MDRPPLLGQGIAGARHPAGSAGVTGTVARATAVIAGAVEDGANTVGEVVADVIESAGNRTQDRLRRGRGGPRGPSGTGPPPAGAAAWIGSVVAGLANVTGAVVKGPAGLVGGVLAGLVRVLGGLVGLDRGLVTRGLVDVASSTVGAVLVGLGTAVSMIQRVLGLQARDRPLSAAEREMLRSVFLDSLALYNIRLIEGRSGVFGFNGRPFTLANTIYMKRVDLEVHPSVLVHECVHVWQYQHLGSRYTMDALGAQARYGRGAYDWEAELGRGRSRWTDFNKESQAEFVQDLWEDGPFTARTADPHPAEGSSENAEAALPASAVGIPPVAKFVTDSGDDRTEFAAESVAVLRSRTSRRRSASFDRPPPHGPQS